MTAMHKELSLNVGVVIVAVVLGSACGGSSTSPSGAPAAPSTPSVTLSGTFSGPASDSSGPGTMTWRLTQAGTAVSGTMTAMTPLGTVVFRGNISGTISGTTLTFTIIVPPGGVSAIPSCAINISGTASGITATTLAGTYSGTSTCSPPFNNGEFNLIKQ